MARVFIEVETADGSKTAVGDFDGMPVMGFVASMDAAQKTDYSRERDPEAPTSEKVSSQADVSHACQLAGAVVDLAANAD